MNVDDHPSEAQLSAWVRHSLDEASEEALETHLLTCEHCARRLDEIDYADHVSKLLNIPANALTETVLKQFSTAHDGKFTPKRDAVARPSDRWRRERFLAAGGIGEVWVGVDTLLNRRVAIKYLKPATANLTSVQLRFLEEARVTAQLSHPGTVHVLDVHDNGPESFYAMTLVRGRPLSRSIQELHKTIDGSEVTFKSQVSQLVRHWVTVARTIAYAHSEGVLHRDLKSENVIVGDFGQVTVIDWGLAKRIGSSEANHIPDEKTELNSPLSTQPGSRLGTPCFMAPEQVAGSVMDERTDVWGLGAMLYEILTGSPPFNGTTPQDVFVAVQEDPLILPHELISHVPKPLSLLCARSLSKVPSDRYQSAEIFADVIDDWLNHEAALRQFDAGRQKLFDLSEDLMIAFDQSPKIVWRNAAWKTVLGWEPDEHYGCEPNVLVHPEDKSGDEDVLSRLAAGKTAAGMERRVRASDGTYRWYSWTATPLIDEGITFAIGRSIDEHVRRGLDYASLLNAAPDATLVIDGDRRIRMVNQQAGEMFGYCSSELIGEPIELLIPERFRNAHPAHVDRYAATPEVRPLSAREGLFGLRKDGTEFRVSIRLSPVQLQSSTQYVAAVRRC